jgi:hypothetical protein
MKVYVATITQNVVFAVSEFEKGMTAKSTLNELVEEYYPKVIENAGTSFADVKIKEAKSLRDIPEDWKEDQPFGLNKNDDRTVRELFNDHKSGDIITIKGKKFKLTAVK